MDEHTGPSGDEIGATQKLFSRWLAEQRIDRRTFLKWSGILSVSSSALFGGMLATSQAAFAAGWTPKTAPLMTQWAAQVSPTNAWPEYPRPQMARPNLTSPIWQNLNGVWQFDWSTGSDAPPFDQNLSQSILVPYPIESALSGIMAYQPYMWYRTTFTVPAGWSGQRILLNFGAVDWQATVYLNRQQIGVHTGGYSSFSFDITNYLNGGTNELIVHVYDDTENNTNPAQPIGKQRLGNRGPGSVFYTSASGIWQTVWLEPVSSASITRLDMTPDIDNQRLRLTVQGTGINGQTIQVTASTNGTTVGTATGAVGSEIDIAIPNPHLWSPEDPFLYDLQVSLVHGASTIDQVTSYFGMRLVSLERVGGVVRPVLNHRFQFLIGTLDQGFWPDGIYTAPTDAALQYDIQQTKALGYNAIRKHMKVEADRWYYWADHLGVVVWQDMPAKWDGSTTASIPNYTSEFQAIVNQHLSTTSIITWTPFNEGWGQPDAGTVRQIVSSLRSWDPHRFIDDASGGAYDGTDVGVGDMLDSHFYPGPFCYPPSATRASIQGEYGGLQYVVPNHVWYPGQTVSGYPTTPAALTQAAVNEVQAIQADMLSQGASGAFWTQITDVEGELNGIITYDRAVYKMNEGQLAVVNQAALTAGQALDPNTSRVVWLRADAGVSVNGSGQVSSWADQSGNGNNAAVGTGQPTLVNNALNGHPVLHFDGATSQLALPRAVQDDFTLVAVFRSTQGVGSNNAWYNSAGIIDAEVAGVVNDFGMGLSAQGQINAGTGNPDTFASSPGGYNDGHPHVVVFKRTRSSGNLTLYVDGNQVATAIGGTQSLTSPTRITLGSTQTNINYLNGDIAEVCLYNTPLSDTTRQGLEGSLLSKYIGVPTSGLVSWLRADAGVSVNGSGQVSSWADQSGNGNNAAVGTGQPTLVNNALNGHPVLHFDGATSQLVMPRAVQDDFTLVAVFRSTQGVGSNNAWYNSAGIIDAEVAGVVNDFGMGLSAQGQINAGTGNPDTFASSPGGYNDGNVHIATFRRTHSTGALTLYLDGQQIATAVGGTQSLTSPTRITLGSTQTNTNYLNGDIAEVCLYNISLSESTRQGLEGSLLSKYTGF